MRPSTIHGRGLFASAEFASDEAIINYGGDLVEWENLLAALDEDRPMGHTFLFDVGDGLVIDGGRNGNDARWINHSCDPNCYADVDDYVVTIRAAREIQAGEELLLDYQLVLDDDAALERDSYACVCGATACRTTMLAS